MEFNQIRGVAIVNYSGYEGSDYRLTQILPLECRFQPPLGLRAWDFFSLSQLELSLRNLSNSTLLLTFLLTTWLLHYFNGIFYIDCVDVSLAVYSKKVASPDSLEISDGDDTFLKYNRKFRRKS